VEAFDGFFGTGPRIRTITVQFIPDTNAELAAILGGQTDVHLGGALGVEQAVVLKDQWESAGAGHVAVVPHGISHVRFGPADPRNKDLSLRKALIYGMDRQGIVNSLYNGLLPIAHSWINPGSPGFDVIDAQTTKYAYEPTRAAQALADLSWHKSNDGLLHNDRGEVFDLPFAATAGNAAQGQLQTAIANQWSSLGLDVKIENPSPSVTSGPDYVIPTTELTSIGADFESTVSRVDSGELRTRQRPRGANVLGEKNPEVDRLLDQWKQSLDGAASGRTVAQVVHLLSEDLVTLPINYRAEVVAIRAGVTGVPESRVEVAGNNFTWNVEYWDRV